MSDRGNELTGGPEFSGGVPADLPPDGAFDDRPFELLDSIEALEPASDLDDVAFGLDVNPDHVDLTFDPDWHSSVSGRSWGDAAGDHAWGDPRIDRGWGDAGRLGPDG